MTIDWIGQDVKEVIQDLLGDRQGAEEFLGELQGDVALFEFIVDMAPAYDRKIARRDLIRIENSAIKLGAAIASSNGRATNAMADVAASKPTSESHPDPGREYLWRMASLLEELAQIAQLARQHVTEHSDSPKLHVPKRFVRDAADSYRNCFGREPSHATNGLFTRIMEAILPELAPYRDVRSFVRSVLEEQKGEKQREN